MKVQLLTFAGCPNAAAAREALGRAVALAGVSAEIEEIDTAAASCPEALRAWGSPTILVDGRDVGGELAPTGTSCRLYRVEGGAAAGAPSPEAIAEALRGSYLAGPA